MLIWYFPHPQFGARIAMFLSKCFGHLHLPQLHYIVRGWLLIAAF